LLAINGESGFVAGFLHDFDRLRGPSAEGVGEDIALDAELLLEHLLRTDDLFAQPAIQAQGRHVLADALGGLLVHEVAGLFPRPDGK